MEKYSEDISLLRFHRINAERDIIPEYESDNAKVEYNGDNLTNLIGMYINRAGLSEEIVEKTILEELNKIMGKDAHFTGIRVQEIDEKDNSGEGQGRYKWEIFLEENGKRYSLSKSGSGLKTIIMVLVNLYLIPMTEGCNSADIVYAFEELENNLHPALQRRLFEFLYRYSIENGVRIFLTSHSPVAINTFYGRDNTNIYHVTKDDSGSHLLRIMCGEKAQEVLYDLGVKASDLFQTNGIIWVEGPSDRIYIKRWVEIIGGAEMFTEGQDYQFMFYGGRLLSHLSAKPFDEKEEDELIKLLTVNHNAVLVMDSDKTDSKSKINKTKQRIKKELEDNGCICWVTAGKEIENYISHDAINKAYNADLKQIPQYEDFSEYISEYNKTYESNKVVGARHICEYIDKDNYDAGFDLREKIEDIIKAILKWNKVEKT
jgi:predicted ATP-dependent endonuclease of OLD family